MNLRNYTTVDKILSNLNFSLMTVFARPTESRANPSSHLHEPDLSLAEKRHAAGLMRVNHCGEICAQALYQGQQIFAKTKSTQDFLTQACAEESDHLAWTSERLTELQSHTSYLNFFWYTHSFLLGMLVSTCGDAWSLGFVEETENQVTRHLESHLSRLPATDTKSHAIVAKMREDEARHSQNAAGLGARKLPAPIKKLMSLHAKVMTTLSYWL